MTRELREAAERLRRVKDGDTVFHVYVDVCDGTPSLHTANMWLCDKALLAEAWLAQNKADDDEPVTEEWLDRSGFRLDSLMASILLPPVNDGAAIVELFMIPDAEPSRDWMIDLRQGVPDDQNVPDDHISLTSLIVTNRGQVRRLCAALGIDLKEKK